MPAATVVATAEEQLDFIESHVPVDAATVVAEEQLLLEEHVSLLAATVVADSLHEDLLEHSDSVFEATVCVWAVAESGQHDLPSSVLVEATVVVVAAVLPSHESMHEPTPPVRAW